MKDEIKYKSKEEIENIAFHVLRKSNNKSLLNNKNVDCFLIGYEHAILDIKEQINKQKETDFKDYLEQMKVYCSENYHDLKINLGYVHQESAIAMLKLYDQMMKCCDFLIENLDNVKMNHLDYYKKLKEQKNGK